MYLRKYFETGKESDTDPATLQKVMHDSLYQYIEALVTRLPEKRRMIFLKSRFEGKSIAEIAEELNISHKTVENQLTMALRFLRIHLNSELK